MFEQRTWIKPPKARKESAWLRWHSCRVAGSGRSWWHRFPVCGEVLFSWRLCALRHWQCEYTPVDMAHTLSQAKKTSPQRAFLLFAYKFHVFALSPWNCKEFFTIPANTGRKKGIPLPAQGSWRSPSLFGFGEKIRAGNGSCGSMIPAAAKKTQSVLFQKNRARKRVPVRSLVFAGGHYLAPWRFWCE